MIVALDLFRTDCESLMWVLDDHPEVSYTHKKGWFWFDKLVIDGPPSIREVISEWERDRNDMTIW